MERGIKSLMLEELHDILNAEEQIVQVLPEMSRAAESPLLKQAFDKHLKETKNQIQRLNKVFKILKVERKERFCKAAKGLIMETMEMLKHFQKSPLRDSALIAKAQRIEHYEISAYGTLRTFARELDQDEVADLLQETLDEEANADKSLTKIAEGGLFRTGINQQANMAEAGKRFSPTTHGTRYPKTASRARKTSKTRSRRTTTTARRKTTSPMMSKSMTSMRKTGPMGIQKGMTSMRKTTSIPKSKHMAMGKMSMRKTTMPKARTSRQKELRSLAMR